MDPLVLPLIDPLVLPLVDPVLVVGPMSRLRVESERYSVSV